MESSLANDIVLTPADLEKAQTMLLQLNIE